VLLDRHCEDGHLYMIDVINRSAIADKPRCSMGKLTHKYKYEKRASNIALLYGTKDILKC